MNNKINTLVKFLGVEVDEVNVSSYDNNVFEYENNEYLVLTDTEADEKTKEYVKDSLWAFNASFILSFKNIHNKDIEKSLIQIQRNTCESCNEFILAFIGEDNLEEFTNEATKADGRGHFLATYDNAENEERSEDGEILYIYRLN